MKLTKPSYYDSFRCLASNCPDSCCKEWDVQVDEEAADYYRRLTGPLGDRLREVLKDEDGETVMTIENGRCPMWRTDGLCRIQAELGEEALCDVCRDFPRLRHDYGDFVELGLELSCPEAARLILTPAGCDCLIETDGDVLAEYDTEAMDSLKSTRRIALDILTDEHFSPAQALALLLLYGYQAQGELDGDEPEHFDAEAELENAKELAKEADIPGFLQFFRELEILTPQWREMLHAPAAAPMDERTRYLARYLVERYWLQAISDYDLASRVKLVVIGCILVSLLGGHFTRTAQLFSKEIENDADNVDAILDGAYACPAFTDDKLLGMLVK